MKQSCSNQLLALGLSLVALCALIQLELPSWVSSSKINHSNGQAATLIVPTSEISAGDERQLQQEPSCSALSPTRLPLAVGEEEFHLGLDRKFVERMNFTLAFQYLFLDRDIHNGAAAVQEFDLAFYEAWSDSNDGALVAKQGRVDGNATDISGGYDEACHGVFQATLSPTHIVDNIQNLNPFSVHMQGTDCRIRQGFMDAYFNGYLDNFRDAMQRCVALCVPTTGEPCPVVLSGLSQGGGVAIVAALDLKAYDMDPTIITFGAMRAVVGHDPAFPCTDLDTSRHFRFTNSNAAGQYDAIANQRFPADNIQVGHSILLDEINYPMLYLGLDEDRDRFPWSVDMHHRNSYRDRINGLLAMPDDCFPIPLGKWPAGHICHNDDECHGTCVSWTCTDSLLVGGHPCDTDEDCESGSCTWRIGWFHLLRLCE